MVKLPPWDTPAWRLPQELRPLYAAVNRLHELKAESDTPRREIAAALYAIGAAATQLMQLVDALRLFEEKRATVPYFGRA